MTIAIIPARGGSKRIKNKNIKHFFGKPIIAYTIQSAKSSKCFDDVIVSTDSQAILKEGLKYGASIGELRSQKNSDDDASLHQALKEVIYENKINNEEIICVILPTSPLLEVSTIIESIGFMQSRKIDSVLTVSKIYEENKKPFFVDNDRMLKEYKHSNDVNNNIVYDAGQIYCFKAKDIMTRKTLIGPKCKAIELDEKYCQDINTYEDWNLAMKKYKDMVKEGKF